MKKIKIWILIGLLALIGSNINANNYASLTPTDAFTDQTINETKNIVTPLAVPETDYDNIMRIELSWRVSWTIEKIAQEIGMEVDSFSKLNQLENWSPKEKFPFGFFKCIPYSDCKTALVSWYGPGFNGNRMANGERFSSKNPTICAHKVLPFGTKVKLTRIETGKSIIVTVQDRGPFIDNRHFDISQGAAEKLDIIRAGVALCRVEIVK